MGRGGGEVLNPRAPLAPVSAPEFFKLQVPKPWFLGCVGIGCISRPINLLRDGACSSPHRSRHHDMGALSARVSHGQI